MEADFDLDDYRPREQEARLVLTLKPAKTPLRTWLVVAGVGAVVAWNAVQLGGAAVGAAVFLPALFLLVGYRVLVPKPVPSVLRFLDEGIELATERRGWVRVPWDLIRRVVRDGAGGASLDTGTPEEDGRSVARLPKEQLDELLAAAVLPAHVEFIEVPEAAAPRKSWKTFALWVVLVIFFVAIWQLAQS